MRVFGLVPLFLCLVLFVYRSFVISLVSELWPLAFHFWGGAGVCVCIAAVSFCCCCSRLFLLPFHTHFSPSLLLIHSNPFILSSLFLLFPFHESPPHTPTLMPLSSSSSSSSLSRRPQEAHASLPVSPFLLILPLFHVFSCPPFCCCPCTGTYTYTHNHKYARPPSLPPSLPLHPLPVPARQQQVHQLHKQLALQPPSHGMDDHGLADLGKRKGREGGRRM